MLQQIVGFFLSFFSQPSVAGIGLAVVFGAVWLAAYWPPLFRRVWLWAIMAGSALLTLVAVSFVQIPLQALSGQALLAIWGPQVVMRWLLLAGIPAILLSGLVQEGAKLVPVVVYWQRQNRHLEPRLALAVGAVAGAGFGIFEAQWAHNAIFASGWTWEAVTAGGLLALAGFWERFFAIGFHAASSALAGYGLARGWGWQFYLLASLLHGSLNYAALALQARVVNVLQTEIYVAVFALAVSAFALWLRWRRRSMEELLSG